MKLGVILLALDKKKNGLLLAKMMAQSHACKFRKTNLLNLLKKKNLKKQVLVLRFFDENDERSFGLHFLQKCMMNLKSL